MFLSRHKISRTYYGIKTDSVFLNEKDSDFINVHRQYFKLISYVSAAASVSLFICFAFGPLLGFFDYYPFLSYNKYSILLHILTNLHTFVSIFVIVFHTSSFDIMFSSLSLDLSIYYQVMVHHLEQLNTETDNKKIHKALTDLIIYHNTITKYKSEFQDTFSLISFLKVLNAVLALCLLEFAILYSKEFEELIILIVCLLCFVLEIFVFCWFGTILTDKSSKIMFACYSTNWIKFNSSNRRMLFILMENVKQDVILKAGGLAALTLNTWVSILKSSYSYYAILCNVVDTNK